MIQIVLKKQWVTHKFNEQGSWFIQLKKGVLYEWRKDLEGSHRQKISLGKTCSLFRQEYSE